jgi:hypothetical protein
MPTAARGAIALCLLLLAASPFTAPFSTFDFDQHTFTAAVDAAKVKPHKDLSCGMPTPALTSVCAGPELDPIVRAGKLRPRPQPLRTNLRI